MSNPATLPEATRPNIGAGSFAADEPRVETHWTRLLYRDLEAPWHEAQGDGREARESRGRGVERPAYVPSTPARAGAFLLGVYVVVYLAVAGFVHLVAQEEAVVAHPEGGSIVRPESASTPPREATPPHPRFA